MCGICGVVSRDHAFRMSPETLFEMRDSLQHRGPDDAGAYIEPGVALGARRLAILDLSERGHMPMQSADGRYWMTYNGEVYNYKELRSLLEAKGYAFRSNTDTEVVLALFAEEGPAMLGRLNGMFAIAIWDSSKRELFLARDRLGVKPLVYCLRGEELYFASEAKALFAAGTRTEVAPDVWEELLCFRYVAGAQTPFLGIRRLDPGHYLVWRDGHVRIQRWWNLAERARERQESLPRDTFQWFRETFDDAVRLRRISDVPIGVLLSGGLDSSSVAASLAKQSDSPVSSFTVRFSEKQYDEGPLAREVAALWGLEYHELTVSPQQLFETLHTVARLNDEPLAHGNDPHLWMISRFAKPLVTVLLSGEGADETMGGYVRYAPLRYSGALRTGRRIAAAVSRAIPWQRGQKLARLLRMGGPQDWVLYNACDTLPPDLTMLGMTPRMEFPYREEVVAEAKALYPDDLARQAMYTDQATFLVSILDRNDRMTMGASIECRVPFLDFRLVETLAAMPSRTLLSMGRGKWLIRQSVGSRLPASVLTHRKWGFGVPWGKYFREVPEFRELLDRLHESEAVRTGPFERAKVREVIRRFIAGEGVLDGLVRQLVLIAVWYDAVVGTHRRVDVQRLTAGERV